MFHYNIYMDNILTLPHDSDLMAAFETTDGRKNASQMLDLPVASRAVTNNVRHFSEGNLHEHICSEQ